MYNLNSIIGIIDIFKSYIKNISPTTKIKPKQHPKTNTSQKKKKNQNQF